MLKKRKRRKVNRRHTEPGLGASSGVGSETSTAGGVGGGGGGSALPPSTNTASTSSVSGGTAVTVTAASQATASGAPLPSLVNSGGGGCKSRRALTALRSDAAIGASQFSLHTQVCPQAFHPIK